MTEQEYKDAKELVVNLNRQIIQLNSHLFIQQALRT